VIWTRSRQDKNDNNCKYKRKLTDQANENSNVYTFSSRTNKSTSLVYRSIYLLQEYYSTADSHKQSSSGLGYQNTPYPPKNMFCGRVIVYLSRCAGVAADCAYLVKPHNKDIFGFSFGNYCTYVFSNSTEAWYYLFEARITTFYAWFIYLTLPTAPGRRVAGEIILEHWPTVVISEDSWLLGYEYGKRRACRARIPGGASWKAHWCLALSSPPFLFLADDSFVVPFDISQKLLSRNFEFAPHPKLCTASPGLLGDRETSPSFTNDNT